MSAFLCRILTVVLCGLTLIFSAHSAHAQASRVYFAGYLGLNMNSESAFDESSTPASGDIKFKNAGSLAGAIGLRLTPAARIEGEISYRKADMDRIDFSNNGSFKLGGELKTWLYMVNGYYDFDLGLDYYLQPYLSAGIGLAQHEGKILDTSNIAVNADDDSLNLAWQVGTGVKYRVRPELAFTGGYRYLGTTDIEFDSWNFEYGSHEIRLGVEYDIPVRNFTGHRASGR